MHRSLHNQIAALRTDRDRIKRDYDLMFEEAVYRISKLDAEVETLRADSERYRWLRDCSPARSDRMITIRKRVYREGEYMGFEYPMHEALDAAIDAARAGEKSDE